MYSAEAFGVEESIIICKDLSLLFSSILIHMKHMEIANSSKTHQPIQNRSRANTDQRPWRSEHPLQTSHTRLVLVYMIGKQRENPSLFQCINDGLTVSMKILSQNPLINLLKDKRKIVLIMLLQQ